MYMYISLIKGFPRSGKKLVDIYGIKFKNLAIDIVLSEAIG